MRLILTTINGVSWPMASVLLHFGHADRYPILDFRALWSLEVDTPPVWLERRILEESVIRSGRLHYLITLGGGLTVPFLISNDQCSGIFHKA